MSAKYESGLEAFIRDYAAVDEQTFIDHIREHGVFKLGEFILKSGYFSPIYVDFRGLISSQQLMNETAYMVQKLVKEAKLNYDYVVGVPYAALSLGSRVSLFTNKPLLMQRKEAKTYGTKKLIEGVYEQGGRTLIIEDVVTTGASILDTVRALRNEGLIVEDVICVLNREQGGEEALKKGGIQLHSVLKVSQILKYLIQAKEIDEQQLEVIVDALKNPKMADKDGSTRSWALSKRADKLKESPLNEKLLKIMLTKKTNLCVALDLPEASKVLEIANQIQKNVCAIKLHADSLVGANDEFFAEIRQLAENGQFVLFEDRKFADTGNTNYLQLVNGPSKIAKWADVVTVHSLPGLDSVQSFIPAIIDSNSTVSGLLLVAELSTDGALTSEGAYTTKTIQIAQQCPHVVSGFICQKRCADETGLLYWTPGVNLQKNGDGKGQKWRGVEDAIVRDGNDIIIVGRGITEASDVKVEALRYQEAAWKALQEREK